MAEPNQDELIALLPEFEGKKRAAFVIELSNLLREGDQRKDSAPIHWFGAFTWPKLIAPVEVTFNYFKALHHLLSNRLFNDETQTPASPQPRARWCSPCSMPSTAMMRPLRIPDASNDKDAGRSHQKLPRDGRAIGMRLDFGTH